MQNTPELLHSGDKVAVLSSARLITLQEIQPAVNLFDSWGLDVCLGSTIGKKCGQFAGSDKERAEDIQHMLEDKDIKAVFFARGGYGTVRILDIVDWQPLKTNPKWLVGYSDVTAALMHVFFTLNMPSLHAIMPVNITDNSDNTAVLTLKNALFTGTNRLTAKAHKLNIQGDAEAVMVGGNLSVIYSLTGSESFGDTAGKILFIEDLDEYLYHIDRMMQALKRAGKLSGLKALVVGQMSGMHDNAVPFSQDAYEIIYNCVKQYNYPVCFGIPSGHIGTDNHALLQGVKTSLHIDDDGVTINQSLL